MAATHFFLIAMIFAAGALAVPAPRKSAVQGEISNDVDEEQRSEAGSCASVPNGYCAVLYDDENCSGWSYNVPTGSYDLPEGNRNDAEVVVVAAGCRLTGYNKNGSGGGSSFCDAVNSESDIFCDIFDGYLRDKYNSVTCLCR